MSLLRHRNTIVACIVIVFACCYWILPVTEWSEVAQGRYTTKNGETVDSLNGRSTQRTGRARNKPKASSIEDRIKAARGNPSKLVALFGEAEKVGLLEDANWRRFYFEIMNRFSPEQIGQMYAAMSRPSTHSHFNAVCGSNWSDDINDPSKQQRVFDILNSIPDMGSRSELVRRVLKGSDLLSPRHFHKTLSRIQRVDNEAIAAAIRLQMKHLDDAAFRVTVEKYFQLTENPTIIKPMAKELVVRLVKKDVEAAREWLLDAPPDLVSSGDQKLMQALASENVTKGVDFIDTLLARKENERASNAVISLGANYAKQHPEEALNWALALPEFVKKSAKQQVISQALEKLSHEDMQRVKDLAAANKDPEIQWLYDIAVNRQKTK